MTSSNGRQRHADHDANWTKSQDEGHVEATKRDRSPRAGSHAAPLLGTPCHGKSQLFDSTDPRDHATARELCLACPFIAACAEHREEVRRQAGNYGQPEGTWAGELLAPKVRLMVSKRSPHDIDPAVVLRFMNGENLPTTRAEREVITQQWFAEGRGWNALCTRAGWKPERYIQKTKKGAA